MRRSDAVMLDAGAICVLSSIVLFLVAVLSKSVDLALIVCMAYATWLGIGAQDLRRNDWRRSVEGPQDQQIWMHWGKDTLAIALWPLVKRHILGRRKKEEAK